MACSASYFQAVRCHYIQEDYFSSYISWNLFANKAPLHWDILRLFILLILFIQFVCFCDIKSNTTTVQQFLSRTDLAFLTLVRNSPGLLILWLFPLQFTPEQMVPQHEPSITTLAMFFTNTLAMLIVNVSVSFFATILLLRSDCIMCFQVVPSVLKC